LLNCFLYSLINACDRLHVDAGGIGAKYVSGMANGRSFSDNVIGQRNKAALAVKPFDRYLC
jgi:hypothetical protein